MINYFDKIPSISIAKNNKKYFSKSYCTCLLIFILSFMNNQMYIKAATLPIQIIKKNIENILTQNITILQ